ncbi:MULTISPECIES: hypothetical protein [Micrococcaceae]|uniref:hypothetical protein n=1 Tax=Micrococcaceae TaxID=1268 RepID=UPI0016126B4B|nr:MULTISPECIES: hypothetical protein [Micrococcaceae]MBB5749310.1 hypothetical protein [Micrococcus sp. TA1]HRO30273.1 hypothetical protein [Citricoccus sp.]HRO93109.1 hypothetical protein [Citricoccus sp.]
MRWERLFADLEAQLAQGQWQDTEAEAAEMTRGEHAGITLADRIRGALGATLQIQLTQGERLQMTVSTVGEEWLGGSDRGGSLLVHLEGVLSVDAPLALATPEDSPGRRRLGISAAYRTLSRARAGVVVYGRDGRSLGEGTIDRVGRDHFDLAVHPRDEHRRGRNVRGLRVIPFSAVQVVRSAHASSV